MTNFFLAVIALSILSQIKDGWTKFAILLGAVVIEIGIEVIGSIH